MIPILLAAEATHSSLDLFEKPPLLVIFENAFTQKIGPPVSPDSPMIEFEALGDRNNCIDLQRTRLEIVARMFIIKLLYCELMLQRQHNKTPHIWLIIPFHIYFPNAQYP